MVINHDYRKDFAERLRVTLAKTKIKQKDIADAIGVSKQFISQVANGDTTFTAEQWPIVYDLLSVSASDSDLNELTMFFHKAKSGLGADLPESLISASCNPLKMVIIDDMQHLTDDQLIKLHKIVQQLKVNNLDKMAENAGL